MKDSEITQVVDNLSRLIYSTMKELSSEQKHPGMCADTEAIEKRYNKLTSMRERFERICTGVI